MSRPLKLAPLQTSLRHVRRSAHNADFCRLRISKNPANAQEMKYFFYAGYWLEWFWGNNYQVEKREKVKFTDMDYDCIMIMYVQYI